MLKTITKAGVAALTLASFIGSAQATGLGEGDGSWAGVYVGGHAGGAWGDGNMTANTFFGPPFVGDSSDNFDMSGWLAGAHVGANVQSGAWVLGGEFSLSAAGIDGSKGEGCAPQSFNLGNNDRVDLTFPCKKDDEWLALAMSRFGYAPGNIMGYFTVGVAVAGAQTTNSYTQSFSSGGISESYGPLPFSAGSSTDVGLALGGGAEMQLGNGLIAGVEYVHVEFDDMRDGLEGVVFDCSQDLDIVRARLSMMLDSCCGGAAAAPSKSGFAGLLPATGSTWSGVYFGGHVGGGWANTDAKIYGVTDSTTALKDSFDQDGWLAGVHLGANVQRGSFVFGNELSLSAADISGSKSEGCFGPLGSGQSLSDESLSLGCKKEDEWLLLAMSRIGYAPSNWMAYVSFGLGVAGSQTDLTSNVSLEDFFQATGLPLSSGVNTDVGVAIGGGAEMMLGHGIIAGVEYVHVDFQESRNGADFLVNEWDQDLDLVRARFSMMLNACCEAAAPSKTNLAAAAPSGWTGFYFGSHAGLGWADATVSFQDLVGNEVPTLGPTYEDSFDMDGYLTGVQFGGNLQMGAFVLGGELSVSGGEIDGSLGPDCFAEISEGIPFECKKQDQWLMLALGRLGYAPGAWMGYVTAGAAVVGFQTDTLEEGFRDTSGSDNDLGYAFGGGAEFQLTEDLVAGVEYIHAEFDGESDGGIFEFVPNWEQDMDIVRAKLSVRFGGGCCAAAPAAAPLK